MAEMKELILIKLGGSVITDKSKEYFAREENISRLAGEIKSALKIAKAKIIIGHGAGSFAHIPASIYKTKEGLKGNRSLYGACVTEEAARLLNQIVVKKFISQKIPVFPFSPGSFVISDAKVCSKSYIDPIEKALEIGIVPVVYGDVVLDRKLGFTIFSTEKVLSILVSQFVKNYKIRMIYVSDVDGVFDQKGEIISQITNDNFDKLKPSIIGARGIDVTGGMLHKVEEAVSLAEKYKIDTLIINGMKNGILKNTILGNKVVGTIIE
jgi:isopentenyl phosphate kinase